MAKKIEYNVSDSLGPALDFAVAYAINRDYSQVPEFLESFKFKLDTQQVVDHFGNVFNPSENSELAIDLFSNFAVSVFPLTDATWGAREYITECKESCTETKGVDGPTAYRAAGLRALAMTTTQGKIVVTDKEWKILKRYVSTKGVEHGTSN